MQAREVIDLEKGIDDQLPVGRAPHGVLAVEAMATDADGFQIAVEITQIAGDVQRLAAIRTVGRGIEHRPDQAMPYGRGQPAQAEEMALQVGNASGRGRPASVPSSL